MSDLSIGYNLVSTWAGACDWLSCHKCYVHVDELSWIC